MKQGVCITALKHNTALCSCECRFIFCDYLFKKPQTPVSGAVPRCWQWGCLCRQRPVPAGSARDLLQGTAQPVGKAGDASGKACLRRGKRPHRQRGWGKKRGRKNPTNTRTRAGGEQVTEQVSTLQSVGRTVPEQFYPEGLQPVGRTHAGAGERSCWDRPPPPFLCWVGARNEGVKLGLGGGWVRTRGFVFFSPPNSILIGNKLN